MDELDMSDDPELESLLQFLKAGHGFDFTGYKRSSIRRRVVKRMQSVGIEAFDSYRAHLENHPEEFEPLFNTVLINVSSFFRDEETWKYLQGTIFPRILERSKR